MRVESCGLTGPHDAHEHGHLAQPAPVWCEGVPEVRTEADWSVVRAAAKTEAYRDILAEVEERLKTAPPFTDTRPLTDLRILLADRIRAEGG